jgi:hypothetical protein
LEGDVGRGADGRRVERPRRVDRLVAIDAYGQEGEPAPWRAFLSQLGCHFTLVRTHPSGGKKGGVDKGAGIAIGFEGGDVVGGGNLTSSCTVCVSKGKGQEEA